MPAQTNLSPRCLSDIRQCGATASPVRATFMRPRQMARSGQALYQAGAHGPGRGRGAGGQSELAQDVGQVPVDRVLAQNKPLRDVGITQSLRDELEYLQLARR